MSGRKKLERHNHKGVATHSQNLTQVVEEEKVEEMQVRGGTTEEEEEVD